jgi:nucleotide-binding universal stress UspA family protein
MNEAPILVALDGSQLSEAAVPYAVAMAKALNTSVIVLGVLEPQPPSDLFPTHASAEAQERFRSYLDMVAKRVESQSVQSEVNLRSGRPAEEILASIEQVQPRLLVMSTHGRSGLTRWYYGSVAGRMAHDAPVSTLLIGPKAAPRARAGLVRRILVPLDGSALAEAALPVAGEIASSSGAEVVLAQVIWWANQTFMLDMPAGTIDQIHEELMESAKATLARAAARLSLERPVKTSVLRGPPAQTLIDFVADEAIDLVVMASHCRAGVGRAALGSVADRMLQSSAPVLLVRPEVEEETGRVSEPASARVTSER